MKRKLVIYNEAKRHWFRQQLPPAVLNVDPANMVAARDDRTESTRLFLMTFVAGFMAFSAFIN